MHLEINKAPGESIVIIKNLMQFYIYDFSEFIESDVKEDGLFDAYPNLEKYWEEKNHRFPYLIKKEENYIGFVLVRLIESKERSHFSIAEFFIMRKYRRRGIGKTVARYIFNLHRGQWEVYQKESNKPAQLFWKEVISGHFKEHLENGRLIQEFEN